MIDKKILEKVIRSLFSPNSLKNWYRQHILIGTPLDTKNMLYIQQTYKKLVEEEQKKDFLKNPYSAWDFMMGDKVIVKLDTIEQDSIGTVLEYSEKNGMELFTVKLDYNIDRKENVVVEPYPFSTMYVPLEYLSKCN